MSDNNRVMIFDTTLRDGEQSPGASMNTAEKGRIATQLERLGVDVLEAGFPAASPGDLEAVQAISKKVRGLSVAALARTSKEDIDACQIYDCFTYTVEVTLQDYGFFSPGEGKDWFQDGRTAPGGSLPVNTSGGQLAEAYFMGLTPITEAAMQLMGRCDQRQLGPETGTRSPEIILCSDNGAMLQTHTCLILRRM